MMESKTFPAELNKLDAMLTHARQFCQKVGISHQIVPRLELAVEEALVNIISYAYPSKKGPIVIFTQQKEPHSFELSIIDEGIPYNPIEHLKKNDPRKRTESGVPGGYGILLIMKMIDHVDYQRKNGQNILTFKHSVR